MFILIKQNIFEDLVFIPYVYIFVPVHVIELSTVCC